MPWRRTRDPYRIWVSEVMLQQTRVATATPFYQRFLARFPSIRALARAPANEVLVAWSGLGYYRRARNLHAAARTVVRECGGRVPDDLQRFARLPGVGRYTAGAVMSIAFDQPRAALDGNAARVLARIYAMQDSIRDAGGALRLWRWADSLVPHRGAGEWNQALMELGAAICTPRSPRCGECPVRVDCRAYGLGTPEAFPPEPLRRATRRVRRAIAIIRRGGRVLMVRRRGPLLEGLWEPPGAELAGARSARAALAKALSELGVRARVSPMHVTLRHRITDRDVEVELWRGVLDGALPRRAGLRYVDPGVGELPVTALARKAARARPARRRAR